MSRMATERLRAFGRSSDQHIDFPDAGHAVTAVPGFLSLGNVIYHPQMKLWLDLGGTALSNGRGQRSAWDHAIKFLSATFAYDPAAHAVLVSRAQEFNACTGITR